MVGQAFDTLIFYPLAFYGVWTDDLLIHIMIANYSQGALGGAADASDLPDRRLAQGAEGVDVFDRGTSMTPFTTRV